MTQKLGDYLLQHQLIRKDQLETALREQRRSRRFLGEILIALGFIKREKFYPTLADFMNLPFVDLLSVNDYRYHPKGWVELNAAEYSDNQQHIALSDPDDLFILHALSQTYPDKNYKLYLIDPLSIIREGQTQSSIKTAEDHAPDLLNEIITRAFEKKASDLHFLPSQQHCQVFIRLDGVLVIMQTLHADQWRILCSHIKVLGRLDLAESRRPQDGSFRFCHKDLLIDCRLSTMPTKNGESLVIRLLDPNSIQMGLQELGICEAQLVKLKLITHLPSGLFIITGPTGSGKTTTLYSMLQEIIPTGRNIMTVEQPIEYRLEGVRQTEIQEEVTGFAQALRSILRHDPDVIYVSEIRDSETAMTAIRAAMTGHLVLTTLHVDDVRLIPRRLADLGVNTNHLRGVLKGAMAQRLLRKKCTDCKGNGCSSCCETGYKGRQLIAEIFIRGYNLEAQYQAEPSERMRSYAEELLQQKLTDLQEIQRVFGSLEMKLDDAA